MTIKGDENISRRHLSEPWVSLQGRITQSHRRKHVSHTIYHPHNIQYVHLLEHHICLLRLVPPTSESAYKDVAGSLSTALSHILMLTLCAKPTQHRPDSTQTPYLTGLFSTLILQRRKRKQQNTKSAFETCYNALTEPLLISNPHIHLPRASWYTIHCSHG